MNKRNILHIILTLITIIPSISLAQNCYTLAWSDEFNGSSLDRDKWNIEVGNGYPDLFGWGNNERQYYTDREDNINVSNGSLKIIAREDNFVANKYTSGRIRSQGNFDFKYGRIEARIKIPSGSGLWPAFWLLPTDKVFGGWPASGEIDIMENFGQDDFISSTIHYLDNSNNNRFNTQTTGFDHDDEYHIFSAVWAEDKIDFFVDWNWIGSEEPGDVRGNWPFNEDFHLILNMALGGTAGTINSNLPQTMEIDYVRVYQNIEDITIQGPYDIYANETIKYSLPYNDDASYNWTTPTGTTIVSGAGTHEIYVTWNDENGEIACNVSNWGGDISGTSTNCGNNKHTLAINVSPSNCDISMLDFDKTQQLFPHTSDGQGGIETMFIKNPNQTGINISDFTGRFGRAGDQQFDVLRLDFNSFIDISSLFDKTEIFKIDLYKTLSSDVPVTVEFVNRVLNTGYPNGIHSQYTGTITSTDSWQTISFDYVNRPDQSIDNNMVDGINILFNPNTNTANTYYFDNIRTTSDLIGKISGPFWTSANSDPVVYTAPFKSGISYEWITDSNVTVISDPISETIELMFLNEGNYTNTINLNAINSMGCQQSYTYEITISDNVGLDNSIGDEVTIFPNPFNDFIRLDNKMNKNLSYELISIDGTIVKSGSINNTIEIECSDLKHGMYSLRLQNDKRITTRKIIKL